MQYALPAIVFSSDYWCGAVTKGISAQLGDARTTQPTVPGRNRICTKIIAVADLKRTWDHRACGNRITAAASSSRADVSAAGLHLAWV